ncbi:MAG: TonB-dependent receptor plug domain-containing protein [Longimicrobiaceae bacterium]|nr:TonB-dependent receptor plug domain-containing protein [Gemmatimonadota bacterium]
MSQSRILPRILVFSLVLTSAAGCHHRSAGPARSSAPDEAQVGHGMHATARTSIGVQSSQPNELGDVETTRIEDLFAGRFAGVQVQRTGVGKILIRIRGVEPLVVVDGLEGDSHLLLGLRPQDVVRIDILKDAGATAIYGERGRNGVIVISTRQRR